MPQHPPPIIRWQENGQACQARWISEAGLPPPVHVVIADDTLSADTAFRLAREGTALLWRGDYQNARHLLKALVRRVDRPPRNPQPAANQTPAALFAQHRAT